MSHICLAPSLANEFLIKGTLFLPPSLSPRVKTIYTKIWNYQDPELLTSGSDGSMWRWTD